MQQLSDDDKSILDVAADSRKNVLSRKSLVGFASVRQVAMHRTVLLVAALTVAVLAFAVDFVFPAITTAPLAAISVIIITMTTNLWIGLAAALVVGSAFSFVDAIAPNGRLADAIIFSAGYAISAVLVEITRRIAARETALSREQSSAKVAHDHLLPKSITDYFPWHFRIIHIPLGDFGGDFYDFRQCGDDLGLLVCDVSGKGLQAAMLLGAVKVLFHEAPLVEVVDRLKRMNDGFMAVSEDGTFCTAWYGHFASDGTVRFTIAGHEPGYVCAGGVITPLPYGGLPLGVSAGMIFEQREVHLAENDMLLLHTDGVSEMLADKHITIEDLFANTAALETRMRTAKRRDDALLIIATRTASHHSI
ncbi:MAG: PP2C family protein-serine/threonine phosphatase [Vulcanimicrobiaceae bacterium]